MGTLVLLVVIILAVLFFRRMIMRLILLAVLAAVGYSALMNQVTAGVESAGSVPQQLFASVKDRINGFFGEGRKIMEPLIGAADLKVELYEYCLADVTWVSGGVNPYACQALPPGRERTACAA